MPKSKTRKRVKQEGSKQIKWGGAAKRSDRILNRILPAAVVILLVGGGLYLWQTVSAARTFSALAQQGQAALARVTTDRDDGRRHLAIGEAQRYPARYPTSGAHSTQWTRAGFYEEFQPPTRLVHAAEHGNVVIYYGDPSPEVIDTLRGWASLYSGQWDGVVVTKSNRLTTGVVLTAWRRQLELDPFDAAAAAAFVDAYRGRGPENAVR